MAKPDFAQVQIAGGVDGSLQAWVDGKVLGFVFTDADGKVCIRLFGSENLQGMKARREA